MSNRDNSSNIKEKFQQALTSTIKVISDDLNLDENLKKDKNSKKIDFFELDNLNTKYDFIKARADADSTALKKKFSNNEIYKKNLPKNFSCKSLYSIAERIRYELLGMKMLKGIEKNFKNNYNQIISLKKKDQLKTKDDVPVSEAFELYMIKNFHGIKLNDLSNKILNFWEKEFDQSITKHLEFLKKNIENQEIYSTRFSEILEKMDIFETEDTENQKENDDETQNKSSENNEENNTDEQKGEKYDEESDASVDADYNIDDVKLDEQLMDTDTNKDGSEEIMQRKNLNNLNLDYKIFTNQFDEIIKAEKLENFEEANKLRKTLDHQLIGFQDLITKLANKLQRQLLAKQNRSWEFDLEEGLLDSSKLPRIIIDPYNSLSFKKEKDLEFKDTIVTLLIDNSGSMREDLLL